MAVFFLFKIIFVWKGKLDAYNWFSEDFKIKRNFYFQSVLPSCHNGWTYFLRRTVHVSRISPESVLNYLKVFLDDDDDDDDDDGGDDDDDDYLNPSHDVLKQLAVDFFTEAFLGVLTPIDVQIIHNELDCPTLKMSWKQKLNMTKKY